MKTIDQPDKNIAPRTAAPPPTNGRRPLLLLGVVLLGMAVLAAITIFARVKAGTELANETKENAIPTVTVVHPERTPQTVEVDLPGNIQAFEETPIYARVNGYLKRWLTDIGAQVTEGQLLAEIETPELDEELNQARAALAQANANLEIARISSERWQNLRKSDSVSQQDTDVKIATWHARVADVKAAEANVQRLTELTRFKQIVAPFSGTITIRTVDVGTLITAGSGHEIFRLAKVDPLRVYISLPQAYSQMTKPGDDASLTLTEIPGKEFTGKVVRTAGAIDPVSRTLLTEVQVSNHDGRLFPGAHAMVKLKLTDNEDPVILPVNTLIFRNEKGTQVGVVDSNGIVRLASITIGRDYGTTIEVVHGLSPTDNVIINPSDSLEPGTHVRLANSGTNKTALNHE
jgi:RND family efflux transporter MFP subunit